MKNLASMYDRVNQMTLPQQATIYVRRSLEGQYRAAGYKDWELIDALNRFCDIVRVRVTSNFISVDLECAPAPLFKQYVFD